MLMWQQQMELIWQVTVSHVALLFWTTISQVFLQHILAIMLSHVCSSSVRGSRFLLRPPQQACTCILTVQLSQPLSDNCTPIQGRMPEFKTILTIFTGFTDLKSLSCEDDDGIFEDDILACQCQWEEGFEITRFISLSGHLCLFLSQFSRVFQETTFCQIIYKLC